MNSVTLNPEQAKAAYTLDANVGVSAGAGTGKTSVLVERFLQIIRKNLALPGEILTITFTEKAANEMKSRIVAQLKEEGFHGARREIENAYLGTIHSFCSRILREHPIEAGIDPDFRVIEENEAGVLKESILDQILQRRFEESEIFDLLYYYSEDQVRDGIKKIYSKIQTLGMTVEEAKSKQPPFSESELKLKAIKAFQNLAAFADKADLVKPMMAFLESAPAASWQTIDTLKEFRSAFRKAGKVKEAVTKVHEALDELIAFYMESVCAEFKTAFWSLLESFVNEYEILKNSQSFLDFDDLQIGVVKLLGSQSASSIALRDYYQNKFKFILVDEFQDTDPLQHHLIELLKAKANLFMVGDFKQSIYGFRGADPYSFRSKIEGLKVEKTGIQISLTENFRSEAPLIHFFNSFFSTLWNDGSFAYESIRPATPSPHPSPIGREQGEGSIDFSVDWLEAGREDDQSLDQARIGEARQIALKIQALVSSGRYEYKDFAILFRVGTKINLYEQEFRNLRVPYYVVSGRGFYEQPEVRDLMNFLTVIENPLKDIPLAAVLRSPLYFVTDDTLFWISRYAKQSDKLNPFFEGFKNFESIPEISESEKEKLRRFKILFDRLIREKERLGVSGVIETILRETQYDLYVLSLSQGGRHFANLKKLISLARGLENQSVIHLGDFVRYIKGLESFEVRESEAQVEAEEGNVVRLLTIHKAKGLEFKCVIIPDLIRRSNLSEGRFVFDEAYGLGIKAMNPESGEWKQPLCYESILMKMKQNETEESKRLLYVAMTRAKEKLILSSTGQESESDKAPGEGWHSWLKEFIDRNESLIQKMSPAEIHQKFYRKHKSLADSKAIKAKLLAAQPIRINQTPEEIAAITNRLKPLEVIPFDRVDLPVSAYQAFLYDPLHENYRNTYELGAAQDEAALAIVKQFEELNQDEPDEKIQPKEFGTLVHQIFERVLLWSSETAMPLDEWIRFYGRDFDTAVQVKVRELVQVFLKSGLFANIQKAKRVWTELPFVLRLHNGLIQGTLDLLYETAAGELIIVDYKTSEVNSGNLQEKGESYREQMELYLLACHEILGVMPAKAVLYFVKMDATYDILSEMSDPGQLKSKFESLQKDIIRFRKNLLTGA